MTPKKAVAKAPAPQPAAPAAEHRRHRLLQAIIAGEEEADTAGLPEGAAAGSNLTFEQFEALIRKLNDDPRRKSWNRLQAILTDALDDREIKANPEARDFVFVLLHLAYTAKRDSTVEDMGQRLDAALAKLRADDQHGETRRLKAMVREHYESKAGEYETKAQFAREYSRLLKDEFGYEIGHKDIADRWLKGLKPPPH